MASGCNLHAEPWRGCGACHDTLRSQLASLQAEYDLMRGAYQRVTAERDELRRDAAPRCKHDLLPHSCGLCNPKPAPAPTPRPSSSGLGPWIAAAYEGECADCGDGIDPGDQIRADGEGGWLCESCGELL